MGKIIIEFEVMTNEQKPYVEKLTNFASKNGFQILNTTYGNQPNYTGLKEALVYRNELNANQERITKVEIDILKTVFNANEMNKFDVALINKRDA